MRLAVVIPSKGLEPMVRNCLATLQRAIDRAPDVDAHIVLVDDSSEVAYTTSIVPDGMAVDILRLDIPRSFAAACNLGAAHCRDVEWILFLNNDVLVDADVFADVLETIDLLDASICGTRLVYPDGSIQHCGVRFDDGPRGPYHHEHHTPGDLVPRMPGLFQAVTAAFLMIRADAFAALGGFDEQFPFGYEDVDLCLRAGRAGMFVACAQATDSLHFHGMSRDDRSAERQRVSRRLFFARWGGRFTIDGRSDAP